MDSGWDSGPEEDTSAQNNNQTYNQGRGRGRPGQERMGRNWWERIHASQVSVQYGHMRVKSSLIGKIVGRGGERIREIEERSKAVIKIGVLSQEDFGQTTAITLWGSAVACHSAQKLIENIENNLPMEIMSEEDPTPINWTEINQIYEEAQKIKWAKLPQMAKNFYVEDPEVANMSEEQVRKFRFDNNNISVSYVFGDGNEPVPNPVVTFEQAFEPYPEILREIYKQNFTRPSPIQAQAWPILLKGHDLIGIAQTGTGKTLAFLLPALIHIENQPVPRCERCGANILVMAPTRELAIQIEKEVSKYQFKNIRSVCIYGGGDRREQIAAVQDGVEIIIATPGRLNDLVAAGVINVQSVTYLVLDEADRMLDMGFEPQIRKTLLDVRPDRQTVMTSATWPEGVRRLAQAYTVNPIQVFVGSLDLAAVHSVTQRIEFVEEENKLERMMDFFRSMTPTNKVIVFVGKKSRADDISSDLSLAGVDCQCIHGGREQFEREQALSDLKSGDVRILIATDVASRGIDIEDVTHIFNYDFPRNIEEYVHRVGRTGRAGKKGESISLLTRSDWSAAKKLIPILEEANQEVPEELRRIAKRCDSWRGRKNQENERAGTDGGRGGGSCYNCNQPGHISRECQEARRWGGDGGGSRGAHEGGGCWGLYKW